MNRYYYDFHIHSCLSPCGDDDMTPNNICGMAVLNGLNIVALTDHNTTKNCPAFFAAAKKNGLIPIAGMELTTAEDIHVVCLFETLEESMRFDEYIGTRRIKILNRTDIFGNQLILDENDEVVGTDEYLLSNATDITIDEVNGIVKEYGGVCWPAHIDRQANGIIATLGVFPDYLDFGCAEFHDKEKIEEYFRKYENVKDKLITVSSDAHYLWDMRDKDAYFEIEDEPYSSAFVRHNLFRKLRGEEG